jgi:hypothetical protein
MGSLIYKYPITIQNDKVYKMIIVGKSGKLGGPQVQKTSQKLTITLKSNELQKKALLYLDNDNENFETLPFSKDMSFGQHTIKIVCKDYKDYIENITITPSKPEYRELDLTPAFGGIKVETEPTGAIVLIDGELLETKTPVTSGKLTSTSHRVIVKMEDGLYKPATRDITVTDGNIENVSIKMEPNFGKVHLSVKPAQADIFIDNKIKRKTTGGTWAWEGNIAKGKYKISARMPGDQYEVYDQDLDVEVNGDYPISINLTGKLGTLSLSPRPIESTILINGKEYNEAGQKYGILNELLIGEYDVVVKKAGYTMYKDKVRVYEKQETNLGDIILEIAKSKVLFESTPKDADLEVDGVMMGKTPQEIPISEGDHKITLKKFGYEDYTENLSVTEFTKNKSFTLAPTGEEVTISSNATNASVYIDGKSAGTIPLNTSLSWGSHTIVLKKDNFDDETKTVSMTKGSSYNTKKIEIAMYAKGAEVNITSYPDGAIAYLDGKEIGKTPLNNYYLPWGSYSFTFKKEKYDDASQSLTLTKGSSYNSSSVSGYLYEHVSGFKRFLRSLGGGRSYYKDLHSALMYGYHTSNFANNSFNGGIETKFGQEFNYRILIYPFMIDMGWFSSRFNVTNASLINNNNNLLIDGDQIIHRGLESTINLKLLNFTRFVTTYAGVGYQLSEVTVGPTYWKGIANPEKDEYGTAIKYSDATIASFTANSPIWKLGATLNIKNLQFFYEMKGTFSNKESKNTQKFIGVAVAF